MLLRSESLEPPMSQLGHERRFRDVCRTSGLPPILTVTADILNRQLVPRTVLCSSPLIGHVGVHVSPMVSITVLASGFSRSASPNTIS